MKLIFCWECHDVVKLVKSEVRRCKCGHSSGKYEDNINAWFSGEMCTPLGFNNFTMGVALRNRPTRGQGKNFGAFVIPMHCETFKYKHKV